MMSPTFTVKHLARHWRLYGMVLAAMVLGAALLSALPMVAALLAEQSLVRSLDDALVPSRNLEIESTTPGVKLTAEHLNMVENSLGSLIQERADILDASLDARQEIFHFDGSHDRVFEFLRLHFWSFSSLERKAQLVTGDWPSAEVRPESDGGSLLEVAIGQKAAELMALQPGDEMIAHMPGDTFDENPLHVRVVAILAPLEPSAEYWWGDPDLLPFSLFREPVGNDFERIIMSVLAHPKAIETSISQFRNTWRLFLDRPTITAANAASIRDQIVNLSSRLSESSARLDTGLVRLVDAYEERAAQAEIGLLLLTAQSLVAVLYTLGLISTYLVEASRPELATMAGRGFGRWQLTRMFGLEALMLAFGLALPLGPLLAYLALRLWASLSGQPSVPPIPSGSWILAAAAVAVGWLALLVPLYLATRLTVPGWLRQVARPARGSGWQILALDFFFLSLGALAYWQFGQTSTSILHADETATADPVLLLGPTVLVLAAGLVSLRLLPYLIQSLAWMSRRRRGFVLPIGLARLARDPVAPSRVILLVGLSAGLSFFSAIFENTLTVRQQEVTHFLTGADITIRQPLSAEEASADRHRVANLPGTVAASPVYRSYARYRSRNFAPLSLLAIDPDTLALVAHYPPGLSPISMTNLVQLLQVNDRDEAFLPVLLSHDAAPRRAQIGDTVVLSVGATDVTFQVAGIIADFPSLTKPFLVTNLDRLQEQVDLNAPSMRVSGERELWLATDPARHSLLIDLLQGQSRAESGLASYQGSRIIGDAGARLRSLQADLTALQSTVAFRLNAIVLVVLGSASFLLVQTISARRRLLEFGILRAIGISPRQWLLSLSLEGLLVLLLGLLLGTSAGFGLAGVMKPLLASLVPGTARNQLAVEWVSLGRMGAVLVAFYAAGTLLMAVGVGRRQLSRVLRFSDE